MPTISKDTAKEQDFGMAVDHTGTIGDYTVDFVTIRETHSLAQMLKGLPGDSCHCPHFGYLLKGKLTVTYADRVEEIGPGDVFLMSPGHVPAAEAGSEFIQISPTSEFEATMQQIAANMAQAQHT